MSIGCATTTDPEPFDRFADSVRTLRDGADLRAGDDAARARTFFLRDLQTGERPLDDLMLEFTGDFDADMSMIGRGGSPPLHMRLEGFRGSLWRLNESLVVYSDLLATLAGGEAIPVSEIDELAERLDAGSTEAAEALSLAVDPQGFALFSTAAVEIFRQVLERRRREGLDEAITTMQPRIVRFADHMRIAVRLLATSIHTDYTRTFAEIHGSDYLDRRQQAEAILELNEATLATLALLEELSLGYAMLPAAHAQLADAAAQRARGLRAIEDFARQAQRLIDTAERLEEAG